jgi:uncharacterized protein YnzC (UPF0291/DUF896 family)
VVSEIEMLDWFKSLTSTGNYSFSDFQNESSSGGLTQQYQQYQSAQQQQYLQQMRQMQFATTTSSIWGLDPMAEKRDTLRRVHDAARAYAYEKVLYA